MTLFSCIAKANWRTFSGSWPLQSKRIPQELQLWSCYNHPEVCTWGNKGEWEVPATAAAKTQPFPHLGHSLVLVRGAHIFTLANFFSAYKISTVNTKGSLAAKYITYAARWHCNRIINVFPLHWLCNGWWTDSESFSGCYIVFFSWLTSFRGQKERFLLALIQHLTLQSDRCFSGQECKPTVAFFTSRISGI